MVDDEAAKIVFSVLGEPRGKERPRFANGRVYTPSGTMSYEAGVVLAYRNRYPDRVRWEKGVPLAMRITACYGMGVEKGPKSGIRMKKKLPAKKPDADNIGKIIADSLNGIAYHDDAQIVDLQVKKVYSENPRVVVEIREAETEPAS